MPSSARPPLFTDAELLARQDEFNRAAERRWSATSERPEQRRALLEKPFANVREAPALAYKLGLALDALDLGPGHTVLDFGAGSCWVSLVLNRLRCRTIAVDVSPAALAVGEEAFRTDPYGRPELEPRFVPYDGHTLPLPAESVDRALCFDSFHHVPNQDEVLRELFRVLRPGGRLVLAEPGEDHAHAPSSLFEAMQYGELENGLVFEDLLRRARQAGFGSVRVKPYPHLSLLEIDADQHLRLLSGDHGAFPLDRAIGNLRQFQVLILFKGEPRRDSRNPGSLRARLTPLQAPRVAGGTGATCRLPMRVENTGDTLWRTAVDAASGGYVRLAGHLLDGQGKLLQVGAFFTPLPCEVAPGEAVETDAVFDLPERPGRYILRLDAVDEGITWFAQEGSPTVDVELEVEWSDSRRPHRLAAAVEAATEPRAEPNGFHLHLRLVNVGDTVWVAQPHDASGTVRVGVQRVDARGQLLQRDFVRLPLPRSVPPGDQVEVEGWVPLPAEEWGGHFAIDLVAEQVAWFSGPERGPLLLYVKRGGDPSR